MKFGGTSVEDAVAITRTAGIVAGRLAKGLQPVVVVSAMSKVTDQLLACAAAASAGRGDREPALEIAARLRARHLDTAAQLVEGTALGVPSRKTSTAPSTPSTNSCAASPSWASSPRAPPTSSSATVSVSPAS